MKSSTTAPTLSAGSHLIALIVLLISVATQVQAQHFAAEFKLEQQAILAGYRYVSIATEGPLTPQERAALTAQGIDILKYNPNGTYDVRIPASLPSTAIPTVAGSRLQRTRSTAAPISLPESSQKVIVLVQFHEGLTADTRQKALATADIDPTAATELASGVLQVEVTPVQARELAQSRLVATVSVVADDLEPLNHEVNILQSTYEVRRQYGLSGEGIVVGIGDGGELGDHIDLDGRVIPEATGVYHGYGQHPDHVSGTVAGRGIINPKHTGVAPDATLITQKTQQIIFQTPTYYEQYGMRITNNSYGTSYSCSSSGEYNSNSSFVDMWSRSYPEVLHVFAAGNSGANSCSSLGYPNGYYNVLRGYQSSKNVLTVGMVNTNKRVRSHSSKGPVMDGRLKPEIVGVGQNVHSLGRNYDYWVTTGTSMAAPAVSGTAALLLERYVEVYNQYPTSDLIKNILCNTAEDIEQPGPDFQAGFGLVNGERAIQVIDNGQFYKNAIDHGATQSTTITVPTGTHELKVMLYYHDYQGSYGNPSNQLINDLDITLTAPDGTVYQPWILDHTPANVANPAQRGTDTLNNIEQVTLAVPAAGTYTVTVSGTAVAMGPQDYTVTYDLIAEGLTLQYPNGTEQLVPGSKVPVTWSDYTDASGKYDLEYSTDGGVSWSVVKNNIATSRTYFDWTMPDSLASSSVRMRISRGSYSDTSDDNFTIIGSPENLTATALCEGYIDLAWSAVPEAATYQVYWYNGSTMQRIATTDTTHFTVQQHLPLGEQQWFAVSAALDGSEGRRSVAQAATPDDAAPCTWPSDVQLVSATLPTTGREATAAALTTTENLSLRLKNSGTDTITSLPLGIRVANQTYEVVADVTILPQQTLDYTLADALDLSATGEYTVEVWTALPGDRYNLRDSLDQPALVRHIANKPYYVDLPTDFYSPYDTIQYTQSTFGISEVQRADYESQGGELILHPEDSDIGYLRLANHGGGQQLVLTYNLAHMEGQPLYAALQHRGGGTDDYLYVRGNDQEEWILLGNFSTQSDWAVDSVYHISQILENASQSLTKATQFMVEKNSTGHLDMSWIEMSTSETTLPVELLAFEAKRHDQNTVDLAWATSLESNVSHFEIEVSTNGIDFATVGLQEAMGEAATYTEYTLTDTDASASTHRYYRLITHFYEGEAPESSDIVVVAPTVAQPDEVTVFPNPVADNTVQVTTSQAGSKTIALLSTTGQTLHTLTTNALDTEMTLPAQLPAGVYYMQVTQGESHSTTRLIVR